MPETVIETIRNGMIGALTDFVHDAGFARQINLIVEMVYELAEYREEDVQFFPSVYLVSRKDGIETLPMIAPGADRISLRRIEIDSGSASQILKDSAALADGGWSVFVDVSETVAEYGLFRSEVLPISMSSADYMADPTAESGAALLVRNCARNCVELLTADGKSMEFALTASRPTDDSVSDGIRLLSEEATRDLPDDTRFAAATYLQRVIARVCQHSHGTLIVIIPARVDGPVPESLRDGVVLQEPIDILGAFNELCDNSEASSLARLAAVETLLRGIIQSDGITVLSSDGKVLAFRVFVKPDQVEHEALSSIDVRGGARSRAYELLKLRVGNPITCAFFRSQDGITKCVVKNE